MKIDKLDNLTNLLMSDKKGSTHKAGSADFQKILEETQADQAAESQKLSESGSVFGRREFPTGLWAFFLSLPLPNWEIPSRPRLDPFRLQIRC